MPTAVGSSCGWWRWLAPVSTEFSLSGLQRRAWRTWTVRGPGCLPVGNEPPEPSRPCLAGLKRRACCGPSGRRHRNRHRRYVVPGHAFDHHAAGEASDPLAPAHAVGIVNNPDWLARLGRSVWCVGLGRFELPTFGPPDRRANQAAPQPVKRRDYRTSPAPAHQPPPKCRDRDCPGPSGLVPVPALYLRRAVPPFSTAPSSNTPAWLMSASAWVLCDVDQRRGAPTLATLVVTAEVAFGDH